MSGEVTVRVESAGEYREAQKHAEALGLSLKKAWFGGNWKDNDGEHVFLSGSNIEIEKVGNKYFHLPLSTPNGTETIPCVPVGGDNMKEAGYVKVTFSG